MWRLTGERTLTLRRSSPSARARLFWNSSCSAANAASDSASRASAAGTNAFGALIRNMGGASITRTVQLSSRP